MKKIIFCLFILKSVVCFSQSNAITQSLEAEIEGGKAALEQVLETQLTLPKSLLTKNFDQSIIIYFELDSLSKPVRITFNTGLNNQLRKELIRVLSFMKFKKQNAADEAPFEYYLSVHLSTEKYKRYLKQGSKGFVKIKNADSSMVVFSKADKSPEYYQNSDEGLAEYILSNIEYPDVARNKSIEGTVVLEFIVETNGFITNLKVKQGVSGGCTEEAIRLMRETKWQPAQITGKAVRYRLNYPITFSLKSNFRDNTTPRQEQY